MGSRPDHIRGGVCPESISTCFYSTTTAARLLPHPQIRRAETSMWSIMICEAIRALNESYHVFDYINYALQENKLKTVFNLVPVIVKKKIIHDRSRRLCLGVLCIPLTSVNTDVPINQ